MKKLITWLSSIRFTQEQLYLVIPAMFIGSVLIIFVVNLIISLLIGA